MGTIKQPRPVKLIASLFAGDETLLAVARGALVKHFGSMDYESDVFPFDHTTYYAPEFGEGLVRQVVAFRDLVSPDSLAEIKRATNELEMTWTVDGRRHVNLDPGYVSLGKLVLATTKNYSHRIYLGQGIYAEVTLRYKQGAFQRWEWTYPDYAGSAYLELFARIRQIYVKQLRAQGSLGA